MRRAFGKPGAKLGRYAVPLGLLVEEVQCGDRIERQSAEQIVAAIRRDFDKESVQVLAPVVDDRKGHHRSLFDQLRKEGYVRVRVDGEERRLDEGGTIDLDKNYRHTIEVVVDRLTKRFGVEVVAVDRYANAPGHQVAHRAHVIAMTDGAALRRLA